MRITFGSSFNEGDRSIARASQALAEAQRLLASGKRIAQLSDDPLGSAMAIAERSTITRLDAYSSTSDAAEYRLSVADSVMSDIVNQLQAAQTTALSARGSTQTQAQRDAAANELLAIRDALLGDINTRFQGGYLFAGSNALVPPYEQTGGGFTGYQGNDAPAQLEVGPGRTVTGSFDGGQLFQGSDPQHVLDALTDLASAVSVGDQAGIAAGVDAVSRAFDRALAMQSHIGNDLRTVDDTRGQASVARTNAVARLSHIEDANLADASIRLSEAETAYRAALSAVATVGRMSLMDYLR